MSAESLFEGAEIIHAYTRAQALDDGVLVDVSEIAREAGFVVPVAVTAALWNVIEPNRRESELGQSYEGRLWDVLNLARFAIKRGRTDPSLARYFGETLDDGVLRFNCIFIMRRPTEYGSRRYRVTLTLKAVSGPGDAGEHVISLMLNHED